MKRTPCDQVHAAKEVVDGILDALAAPRADLHLAVQEAGLEAHAVGHGEREAAAFGLEGIGGLGAQPGLVSATCFLVPLMVSHNFRWVVRSAFWWACPQ
jgi:hypothetical protein